MKRLHRTPGTAATRQTASRAWQGHPQAWLVGLAIASAWLSAAELQAGNPSALATWYCPYTPQGDCTPYTRSYGYTPTRWHRWPNAPGKQGPEAVATPTPAAPPERGEELPPPDTSNFPSLPPQEPGPSDETDVAPPPPGGEPGLPPEIKGGGPAPQQEDLHDLFPEENAAPPNKPTNQPTEKPSAEPTAEPTPEPEPSPADQMKGEELFKDDANEGESTDSDTTEPEEGSSSAPAGGASHSRHGARQTSFTSSAGESKMLWRRSKRLGPSDAWSNDAAAMQKSAGTTVTNPTRGGATAARPALRLSSNPLRDSQALSSTSTSQSQSLAGADTAGTTSFSAAAPAWRANPLRAGQ